MRKSIILILVVLGMQLNVLAQSIDNYYLVEIDTTLLSSRDKQIIRASLDEFHKATDDTSKIQALSGIAVGIESTEKNKYRNFQMNLVEKSLQNATNEQVIQTLNELKGSCLNNTAIYFIDIGKLDSSLTYLKKAHELSIKTNSIEGMIAVNVHFAVVFDILGMPDSALSYLMEVERILNNTKGERLAEKSAVNSTIASTYQKLGDLDNAMAYFNKSLALSEKLEWDDMVAKQSSNIGTILIEQGYYDRALKSLSRAYDIFIKLDSDFGKGRVLGHIGRTYLLKGDTITGTEKLKRAYELAQKSQDRQGLAKGATRLAKLYFAKGENEKAKNYFSEAIQNAKSFGLMEEWIYALQNSAELWMTIGEIDSATIYLDKALQLAIQAKNLSGKRDVFLRYSELYEKMGKYNKSLEYFKKYVQAKDSIVNDKTKYQILSKQINYELEKKQLTERAKAEKEISEKEKENLIIISASILAFVLVSFFFYIIIFRMKMSKKTIHERLKVSESNLTDVVTDNQMRLDYRKKILLELEEIAKNENDSKAIQSVIRNMKHQIIQDEQKETINENISKVNALFENKLKELYPELSKTEIDICKLIKLNLSIKEMASIRNTSESSIKSYRHRIRKKMGLDQENLFDIINNIDYS